MTHHGDILVIGAGPAGMAAAIAASHSGQRILVLDESPAPGGQIWRPSLSPERIHGTRKRLLQAFRNSHAELFPTRHVFSARPGTLQTLTETSDTPETFHFHRLILATGARERFLPFPGWTLPGVFGAGGLQALVRGGLSVRGKRIVVAGTGPLLLAVAAHLRQDGARIAALCEQAPLRQLLPFALHLAARPAKLLQSASLTGSLLGVRYRTGTWPIAAHGTTALEAVTLTTGRRQWTVPCDHLACGFHLVPNTELATLLGCCLQTASETNAETGAVLVDPTQQTTVPGIFCAGEPTGIAGVDSAILQGQIAGFSATGNTAAAAKLLPRCRAEQAFGHAINRAFRLRPELAHLPDAHTIVCRCEDVSFGTLQALATEHNTWTDAKLQTRCGMGSCQGRICGPAVKVLFGWQNTSVRPPIYPVPLAALASTAAAHATPNIPALQETL